MEKDASSCAAPRLNVGPMLMNLGGDPYGLSKTSQSNACSRRPLPAFQCGPRRKTWQRGRGASAPTRGKGGSCGKGGTPNWPSTFEALDAQTKASTCQSKIALSAQYGRIERERNAPTEQRKPLFQNCNVSASLQSLEAGLFKTAIPWIVFRQS